MIDIIPHVGRKANGQEVTLDQMQVMRNGKRVAYCGTKEGQPVNFIRQVDDSLREQVLKAVADCHGKPSGTSEPKPLPLAAKKYMENLNK